MTSKNNKDDIPHLLKIEHWYVELPTGNWNGPEPLPLFPSFEQTNGSDESLLAFRELHIQYHTDSEQQPKIVEWVNNNIPKDLKWLFHGLDVNYVQFQKIFFAHPSVYSIEKKEGSEFRANHPEIFNDDWD
ncbi:MAG: hypothetical protein JKX75_05170, partial [Gammaproteobacteria bacterium]|nr:hypothetical protein [Gammaproteobacteria bacterium]